MSPGGWRAKTSKYRELRKKLAKYDKRFEEHVNRGKGSHRVIFHPDIDGEVAHYPVKYHGENTELGKGYLKAFIRRFNLPDDFFD